jgi:hypothetical protein
MLGHRANGVIVVICAAAAAGSACASPKAALTELMEARQLASELHVQFTKGSEAANRAVMADTDEASAAAADEARRATQTVEQRIQTLRGTLQSLGYAGDLQLLDGFDKRFAEYRQLDDEILPLAVENTNLKAQRLSFGPGREAAEAFSHALDRAVKTGRVAEPIAARARIAVLEIQVLQAPHIAESDDAAMTRMEARMSGLVRTARQALDGLRGAPHDADAVAQLDRFVAIHQEIVKLSRRNSNVRSLALSLGRKRTVTAECEDQLRALEQAIAKHEFSATR